MKLNDHSELGRPNGGTRLGEETLLGPAATVPRPPGQGWVEERTRVAVGPGASVSGHLIFHEPIRIEGIFRGDIVATDLVVVAQRGIVIGSVRAPRMLVLGEMRGEVVGCDRLVLGPYAHVVGRIETAGLTVCEGAYLNGEVRMPRA
ncbi:MAG: polymer-forming cytoskeletal protein [Candidatus Binataceae bacterium]